MIKQKIFLFIAVISCISMLLGCDAEAVNEHNREYNFFVDDVRISVGDDLDDLIDDIPEYNSFYCAPSCSDIGEDELYIYNGFKISAYRGKNGCEITLIELTNDTVSTLEGISIGDTEEKVRLCYGEGERSANTVEYKSKNCILRFYMREGKVISIKYTKNSG